MARGKVKDDAVMLTRKVTVRLTQAQYESLAHEAQLAGMRPSGYLREIIAGRMPKLHADVVLDASDIRPAVVALSRVGNNLNQIAWQLNSGSPLDRSLRERLDRTLLGIREAAGELTSMAARIDGRR